MSDEVNSVDDEIKEEVLPEGDVQSEKAEQTEQSEQSETETSSENENADGSDLLSKVSELEKKLSEAEKERDDFKDKWMRSVADFQNLRKRSIQEKQEAYDYGNASLLKDLLDSLDNFDRTVEAASSATDAKSIADGVTMINKSLVSMLENKYNLVAYGAAGDPFDPDIHEAIGKVDEDVAEPVLKAVYLKGYKLKDRVIRHAKVMVSMPAEQKASE